jgi:hypothetical protein
MAVNAEVMELVRLLDEEGFGWLAGELLSEISLGRETAQDAAQKILVADGEDEDEAELVERVEIPDAEQLGEAVHFLRLRLVEPARALAEAERIAGALSDREAIRVAFVDGNGAPDDRFGSDSRPGDASIADKLDAMLAGILDRPMQQED